MTKPLCIDLYCGLGGWAEGFLAEGYRVIGYDIEKHDYGTGGYPGKLILRDVLTIHGSEFKDAACIVGSSPCQRYSYMAMPWKRAKAMVLYYGDKSHPERLVELNALFNAQFRIQREASRAAGHHIPMVVENVRGAQKWVGRAKCHFGSYYLWGDVPALMPMTKMRGHVDGVKESGRTFCYPAGSANPDAVKGRTGKLHWNDGTAHANIRDGHTHTRHLTNQRESDAIKMGWDNTVPGKVRRVDEITGTKQGGDWLGRECESSMSRLYGSKSPKRKAASAMIAKIPFPLAQHIAKVFKPIEVE